MNHTRQRRLWYVVQTNIQCEERAAKSLRAAKFRVYLPKMKKTIIHHRTKKPIDRYFKLFNRYLFVSLDPNDMDWFRLRRCDGVEKVLGMEIDGKPYEVSREVVRRFMLAQRRGEFDAISPHSKKKRIQGKVPVGSWIRLLPEHPFGGFYGQVVKIKGKGVIKATLDVFGKLIPVEVPPEVVEVAFSGEVKDAA